jgi:CheY-like chemotaxis protein
LNGLRFMGASREPAGSLTHARMPGARVLVVDDVAVNLEVAKGLLEPYGLTVDCVSSGRDAVKRVRTADARYDLILMDHMMPEMDGIEATKAIRNNIDTEYARTVPIVALTANALAGNDAMFLANGFNDYISKPIDTVRLDAVLNRWIKGRRGETKAPAASAPAAEIKNAAARTVPGLDISGGIQRYRSEKIYLRILRSYLKNAPDLLDKLGSPSEESLQDYIISVHGLKGSSYGIHAADVGKQAEALELAAKAGDLETVLEHNGALIASAEQLLKDLSDYLNGNDAQDL